MGNHPGSSGEAEGGSRMSDDKRTLILTKAQAEALVAVALTGDLGKLPETIRKDGREALMLLGVAAGDGPRKG